MAPIRVIVCEDQEIVRDGLATILEREDDIHVVATAATAEHALKLVPKVEPDVAVVDYRLPGMTGVELCERLRDEHKDVKVIILTSFLDEEVIVSALAAGARGFAYKDVAAQELKKSVRDVAEGRTLIDATAAVRAFGQAFQGRDHPDQDLTRREIEVLRRVSLGEHNADIGLHLGLKENTVRTYLKRAMLKLDCHTRGEAVALAAKRGLL